MLGSVAYCWVENSHWEPPVNVIETQTSLWVISAVPGVTAKNVKVELDGNELVISGKRALPDRCRDGELKIWEIPLGQFERRLTVVDVEKTLSVGDVVLRDGLLLIELEEKFMTAEEKENTQTKTAHTIPPGALAILPLRNTVLFPSTIMPLVVRRRNSLQVMEEAVRQELAVGFVTQINASVDKPQTADLYPVGTSASVLRMFGLPDGQRQVIIQGQQRFEIKEFIQTDPFLVARVSMIEEGVPHTKDFDARVLHLHQEALKALSLLPPPLQELRPTIERIEIRSC